MIQGAINFNKCEYPIINDTEYINQISEQIKHYTEIAKETILQMKLTNTDKLNEKRVTANFLPGDIVFVIDNQQIPGNSRVLKTKLSPSPYVVVRSLRTTTIIHRIADGFSALYHNSNIK